MLQARFPWTFPRTTPTGLVWQESRCCRQSQDHTALHQLCSPQIHISAITSVGKVDAQAPGGQIKTCQAVQQLQGKAGKDPRDKDKEMPQALPPTERKTRLCGSHPWHMTDVQDSLGLFYSPKSALADARTNRASFYCPIWEGMAKIKGARLSIEKSMHLISKSPPFLLWYSMTRGWQKAVKKRWYTEGTALPFWGPGSCLKAPLVWLFRLEDSVAIFSTVVIFSWEHSWCCVSI